MTATFSVKNFERFQHYKDRSPPWIKLYNELLDDYDFGCLPDASKWHLIAIWLLASRSNNRIPYDPVWVARRINASDPVDLDALRNSGFIVVDEGCSDPLAECKQAARPERETEGEGETEAEREEEGERAPTGACPLSEAVDAYNDLAEELGLASVQRLTSARKASLRQRLRECGGIEGWYAALAKVRDSPFLRGENDRGWKADFDFLLQAKSFTKLMEGSYDRTGANGSSRPERLTGTAAAIAGLVGSADWR